MVSRSKLSLQERVRPPRAIATTRRRGLDEEVVTYCASVVIAVAAMVMAAIAGL